MVTDEPVVRVEIDPRLEIADADRSNNIFPQEIDQQRFRINPEGDRSNPMQRHRDERLRIEAQIAASRLGSTIAANIRDRQSGTPVPAAARILDFIDETALADPYGQLLSVFNAPDDQGIALIVSVGPDGEPGTKDDVSWIVAEDGSIEERVHRSED
jgi:hypothetical protein